MEYWQERLLKSQNEISNKSIKLINAQMKKYYAYSLKSTISNFVTTYGKIYEKKLQGETPTTADLYKLDTYWKTQQELKEELKKLGEKEIELLSSNFESNYQKIYDKTAKISKSAFTQISNQNAKTAINSIWATDGKTWSERVWNNTAKLAETLNEKLVDCVITGKKPTELKKELIERFNVSYNQADTLVRTEIAHIQTQSAADAMRNCGIEYFEFVADTDERTCPICGKLDGKKFKLSELKVGENCAPLHPKCRCGIVAVQNFSERT